MSLRTPEVPSTATGWMTSFVRADEWRWVAVIAAAVLVLSAAPGLFSTTLGPRNSVPIGTYWHAEDFSQYLAAMREGASSPSWLIHDHFSAETHDAVFMYPLYVAVGKVSAATGLPVMGVYWVLEASMRLILAFSAYFFVSTFVVARGRRRIAFTLALFSGGLGLWGVLVEELTGLPVSPGVRQLDLIEWTAFASFLAAPHLGLGLAAILTGIALFGRACSGSGRALAPLGFTVLALALVQPLNLPVLLGAFLLVCVVRSVGRRRPDVASLTACGVAFGAASAILAYNWVVFTFDPFWSQTYGGPQNALPTPPPPKLPILYGLVLFAAPFGVIAVWKTRSVPHGVLVAWVLVALLCMYASVPYQRRFAYGLQPVLAVLSILGWPLIEELVGRAWERLRIPERLRHAVTRRAVVYPLAFLAFAQTMFIYSAILFSAATDGPISRRSVDRDTYAVAEWMGEHSTGDDVVLSSLTSGNVLAGLVPGRVVVGHAVATLAAAEKLAAVAALYQGSLSRAEIRRFLEANRVTYLLVGPEERKLGRYDPGSDLSLRKAYDVGAVVAYEIR